jgi:DNA-binding NtrC family response regulator
VLLKLPPLREHPDDIPILAGEFCRMLGEKHGRGPVTVSKEAMQKLMALDWKGNVRELKNTLESAMVMSRDDILSLDDFPSDFGIPSLARSHTAGQPDFIAAADYREARRQFEIAYIKAKLREHGGNITRTAAAIGLHRQSLQEKLRELGIQAEKA